MAENVADEALLYQYQPCQRRLLVTFAEAW